MQEVAELLDRLETLGSARARVTVAEIRDSLGRNAFGPALLTLGLLTLSPLGDVPGGPTVLAVFLLGTGAQMAAGRRTLWIPRALAARSVAGRRLCGAARFLRPGARLAGRVLRARWRGLTGPPLDRAIAAACAALALTLPPLEVVPFGATVSGAAITAFAAALVTRDGLLALAALALTAGGLTLVAGLLLDLAA